MSDTPQDTATDGREPCPKCNYHDNVSPHTLHGYFDDFGQYLDIFYCDKCSHTWDDVSQEYKDWVKDHTL